MDRRRFAVGLIIFPLLAFPGAREDALRRIVLGSLPVTVTDPRALLAAARKDQQARVVKTSLWDTYGWPAVVIELARQNEMKEEELVEYLKDSEYGEKFNPWKALHELPIVFESIPEWAQPQIVDKVTVDVAKDVEQAIKEQLGVSYEETNYFHPTDDTTWT